MGQRHLRTARSVLLTSIMRAYIRIRFHVADDNIVFGDDERLQIVVNGILVTVTVQWLPIAASSLAKSAADVGIRKGSLG